MHCIGDNKTLKEIAIEAHNSVCRLLGDISKRNVKKAKDTVGIAYERLKNTNNDLKRWGYPISENSILRLKEDMYFLDALLSYLEKRDETSIRHLYLWSCSPYKGIVDEVLSK